MTQSRNRPRLSTKQLLSELGRSAALGSAMKAPVGTKKRDHAAIQVVKEIENSGVHGDGLVHVLSKIFPNDDDLTTRLSESDSVEVRIALIKSTRKLPQHIRARIAWMENTDIVDALSAREQREAQLTRAS